MSNESREKIAKGALELFLSQGIKTVTMDRIAAALSMSKRTIYENFSDKEDLVSACLCLFKRLSDEKRIEFEQTSENSFVFLLRMFRFGFVTLRRVNVNFFRDIDLLFPDHVKRVKLHRPAQIAQFQSLIEKSQNEGYIMSSLNADELAMIYYGMMTSLRDDETYDFNKISPYEIFKTMCSIYFRGIVTEKGVVLTNQYLKELENSDNN